MKCDGIVNAYLERLRAGFACQPAGEGRLRVLTPYLYPDHDRIEVFVRELGTQFVVSDLGETLRHLDAMGLDAGSSEKRWFQVEKIISGLGVEFVEGIILKRITAEQLGAAVFDVISACKAVGDLAYASRAYEPATFEDEVGALLTQNGFKFDRNSDVRGNTGQIYHVNFAVQTGKSTALIATVSPKINVRPKSRIDAVIRMWMDCNSQPWKISLLNDEKARFTPSDQQLLAQVSNVRLWRARGELIQELSAARAA